MIILNKTDAITKAKARVNIRKASEGGYYVDCPIIHGDFISNTVSIGHKQAKLLRRMCRASTAALFMGFPVNYTSLAAAYVRMGASVSKSIDMVIAHKDHFASTGEYLAIRINPLRHLKLAQAAE